MIRQSLLLLHTPDQMRGRVFAVGSMFTGTSNQLGDFRAGAAAAAFGTIPAVLIGGCCTIAVVLVSTRIFRELYQADRYEPAKQPAKPKWNRKRRCGIIMATQCAASSGGGKDEFMRLALLPVETADWAAACLLDAGGAAASANTAPCGGDFGAWLQGVKTEAAAQGISQRAIQSGLAGITYDPAIIARDHAQGVFRQSFEQFSGRMVPPRLARGQT